MKFTLLIALLHATLTFAAAPSPTPRQVLDESDRRTKSDSQYYEGLIRVTGKDGRVKEKSWRNWRLGTGGGARGMVQFLAPAEVKGVSLFSVAKMGGEDDQWLYTPALQRDRRIAGAAKHERFLGTDFTYEDMQERDLDGADYSFLSETTLDGTLCWVIESIPKKAKKSQYRRSILTIRQKDYAILKMVMEKPDKTERTLIYSDYESVQGILVARTMTLTDPQRPGTTVIALQTVKFHLSLKADFFTRQNLAVIHPPQ